MLESYKAGQRTLHGIIGSHVDDGICGGDQYFYKQLESLKKVLPFGSFKTTEVCVLLEFNWSNSLTSVSWLLKKNM